MILSKQSNDCDPNEILDDGLICCNYSICNEYCYDDICIQPKKIWFCHQEGILFLLIIKFVPSIVFAFIRMLVRLYHKKTIFVIFGKSFIESLFNTWLFSMINGYYCCKYELWEALAGFGTMGVILWVILYVMLFYYLGLPLYKVEETFTYHNIHKDFLSEIKSLRYFVNKSMSICLLIFALTGYYIIFDTFVYPLNKIYRNYVDLNE